MSLPSKTRTRLIKILLIFITISMVYSCNYNNNHFEDKTELAIKEWEQIKKSRELWDLRIYIEKYPEIDKIDSAIDLFFIRINEIRTNGNIPPPPPWHCGRNCRQVILNQLGNIYFENTHITIDSLSNCIFNFISDSSYRDNYAEYIEYKDPDGNYRPITKAKIELVFIKDSVKNLQPTIIQIRKAYENLKNTLCLSWYNKSFDTITEEKRNFLNSNFERRIILTDVSDLPIKWRNKAFK